MTKASVLGWSVALVLAVALSVSAQSTPPVPTGSHVAYISGSRLSRESNAGMAAAGRLQALQQEKAADIRSRQAALVEVQQQLARTADPAARGPLEQDEQQRRSELERSVAEGQREIQNLQRQIGAELMTEVRPILQELLAGTDVQIVLQADGPILWAAPGLDLTPAVLERLNAAPGSGTDQQ